jgi:hypothetical protein
VVHLESKHEKNTALIYTFVTSLFCHINVIGPRPNSPEKIIKDRIKRERGREMQREREGERERESERKRERVRGREREKREKRER